MKLVSVQQMQQLEKTADAAGHTYDAMMELAGQGVAEVIQGEMDVLDKRILVLVGPGNNGGDGLVAARYLAQAGARVVLYLAKPRPSEDLNVKRLEGQQVDWLRLQDDPDRQELRRTLHATDVIVDALLGTGVDRPITGDLADILRAARQITGTRRAPQPAARTYLGAFPQGHTAAQDQTAPMVVAVDVPSGVNCDTGAVDPVTLPADLTVTFAAAKRGQYCFPAPDVLGQLIVADIGIPAQLGAEIQHEVATDAQVRRLLPSRPLNAHKGTFGKAMIVAGSANYVGAAYLAAASAGRIGVGLVTVAAPAALHAILAQKLTEATHLLLPHDMGALVPAALQVLADHVEGYASLLVGPGLGQAPETIRFVHQLLGIRDARQAQHIGFQQHTEPRVAPPTLPPLVVDADALNALASVDSWWSHLPPHSVLTPHPGEMGRLTGQAAKSLNRDRVAVAARYAVEWKQVVVLKGAYSVVAAPDGRATVIPFSTPALATAGTGDVLAGAIAGLLAQGLDPYDAAICGAYLHALAGKMVQKRVGDAGALAGDLLPLLPQAIQRLKDGS